MIFLYPLPSRDASGGIAEGTLDLVQIWFGRVYDQAGTNRFRYATGLAADSVAAAAPVAEPPQNWHDMHLQNLQWMAAEADLQKAAHVL